MRQIRQSPVGRDTAAEMETGVLVVVTLLGLDPLGQLDDELVARLDEIATRVSVSRSELLRRGALAVIEADEWAQADERLVEGYTKYPPDPLLLRASERLAAETAPEW